MRRHQVQKAYLDIQVTLGKLMEEAQSEEQKKLRAISVELVRIKRDMIGTFDEVDTDAIG